MFTAVSPGHMTDTTFNKRILIKIRQPASVFEVRMSHAVEQGDTHYIPLLKRGPVLNVSKIV